MQSLIRTSIRRAAQTQRNFKVGRFNMTATRAMTTARPIPQQKQMHIPAVFGAMLGLGAYLYANSDENA